MRKYFWQFLFSLLIFYFFIFPVVSQAAILPQPTGSCPRGYTCQGGICLGEGQSEDSEFALPCNYTISDILQAGVNFVNLILSVVGGLTLLVFFLGGFWWLTSAGNQDKIKKGKDTLTAGVIGLMIVLGASVIVRFVASNLLGASISPTGEIGAGTAVCVNKADGSDCGEGMACFKGACIPLCERLAYSGYEDFEGFSCQPAEQGKKGKWKPLGAEGRCQEDGEFKFCPGKLKCCITKEREDAIKKSKNK
jgi:hypothetical protein